MASHNPVPSSSSTSADHNDNNSNNMLLAYPSHSGHHGLGHHHLHHHHNQHSIKTPSAKYANPTMASLSVAESSYTSPSNSLIIDNLGEFHDPSYMSALRSLHAEIGNRNSPIPGRRPSSSHASSKPSQLGYNRDLYRNERNDSYSDSDSSDDDDDDNVYSLRSRSQDFTSRDYRSNSIASSARTSFSHSNRVSSSGSQDQQPSPPLTPPPSAPITSSHSKASSRHLSMSGYDNDMAPLPKEREKHRRASWAFRRKHDNSSPSLTPRSAALALAQESEKKSSNDGWGFTGIVDIERQQRAAARESIDEEQEEPASTTNETNGVSKWSSKSMRRKGSNNSSEDQSKSIAASHGTSFFSRSSQDKQSKKMDRHESMSSQREDQARTYSTVDNESFGGLSTILSGMPTTSFDGRCDSRSTLSGSTATHKFSQAETDFYKQQQQEADFILGPSKYKQTKDSIKKKTEEMTEGTPTNNHELRRKMESMALGVRFGAFNVKRKIERGIKG